MAETRVATGDRGSIMEGKQVNVLDKGYIRLIDSGSAINFHSLSNDRVPVGDCFTPDGDFSPSIDSRLYFRFDCYIPEFVIDELEAAQSDLTFQFQARTVQSVGTTIRELDYYLPEINAAAPVESDRSSLAVSRFWDEHIYAERRRLVQHIDTYLTTLMSRNVRWEDILPYMPSCVYVHAFLNCSDAPILGFRRREFYYTATKEVVRVLIDFAQKVAPSKDV